MYSCHDGFSPGDAPHTAALVQVAATAAFDASAVVTRFSSVAATDALTAAAVGRTTSGARCDAFPDSLAVGAADARSEAADRKAAAGRCSSSLPPPAAVLLVAAPAGPDVLASAAAATVVFAAAASAGAAGVAADMMVAGLSTSLVSPPTTAGGAGGAGEQLEAASEVPMAAGEAPATSARRFWYCLSPGDASHTAARFNAGAAAAASDASVEARLSAVVATEAFTAPAAGRAASNFAGRTTSAARCNSADCGSAMGMPVGSTAAAADVATVTCVSFAAAARSGPSFLSAAAAAAPAAVPPPPPIGFDQ